MDPLSKILSLDQADAWIAAQRDVGHRIGFTCGAFDLLHAGHAHYLAQARLLCDRLIVAVNSDDSIRRYKNPHRPVNPQQERMYLVAALAATDAVVSMEDDRPLALLLRWKPDLYIKGGDYQASGLRSAEAVEGYGGQVRVIPPQFGASSTSMLDRIAALAQHATPLPAAPRDWRGMVLLDRDGTLIKNIPFLNRPDQVEILPGVVDGLRKLQDTGFGLAIVSNQQGIGLGYGTADAFIAANQRMLAQLGPQGIRIARIYYCPHSVADVCDCRKPLPGMILRAMRDFAMPAARVAVIGDRQEDLDAATAAGCAGTLVDDGDFPAAAARVLQLIPENRKE